MLNRKIKRHVLFDTATGNLNFIVIVCKVFKSADVVWYSIIKFANLAQFAIEKLVIHIDRQLLTHLPKINFKTLNNISGMQLGRSNCGISPPKISKHCITILTFAETFKE